MSETHWRLSDVIERFDDVVRSSKVVDEKAF